jgi:hypothetical protein
MGAQPTANMTQEQGASFQVGAEKAHVLIVKPEDLGRRNAILDALLNLSALRYTYQLVYLAAPRLFGASIDATAFKSRGIGLLFYDERRIDEAVPAQAQQPQQRVDIPSQQDDVALKTELVALKTMCLQMKQTINQLRDDLTTLQSPHPPREVFRTPSSAPMIATTSSFHEDRLQRGELPSYFSNNPWLDVLSKRGSGENEPLAG